MSIPITLLEIISKCWKQSFPSLTTSIAQATTMEITTDTTNPTISMKIMKETTAEVVATIEIKRVITALLAAQEATETVGKTPIIPETTTAIRAVIESFLSQMKTHVPFMVDTLGVNVSTIPMEIITGPPKEPTIILELIPTGATTI